MLKIRRPLGRLIFNMGIAIPSKTVFLIETAPWSIFSSCLYITYMVGPRRCGCLIAWLCYQLMARLSGGTVAPPWPDPCAYVRECTWPICAWIYVFIDAYIFNCLITRTCNFSFWYYYLILNINPISDEKIIYMCLPGVYTILPVFYCFYYKFLLFVCIHALSEMTK